MQNKVLILDFGSQYTQLIARRVRELNIYCEIHPYNKLPKQIESFDAVILSGSPFSVRSDDAPHPDLSKIKGKIPNAKPLLDGYGVEINGHPTAIPLLSLGTKMVLQQIRILILMTSAQG